MAEPKRLKFPTALTVLAAMLLVVWGARFGPAGASEVDPESDGPVPRTHTSCPRCSGLTG